MPGARAAAGRATRVERLIEKRLVDSLAEKTIAGHIKEGDQLTATVVPDNQIAFSPTT